MSFFQTSGQRCTGYYLRRGRKECASLHSKRGTEIDRINTTPSHEGPRTLLFLPTGTERRRSSEDLRRARVEHARACFVLSDRLAADTEAQDKTALVRALCAHEASPPEASVLCMVTHAKSKGRLVRLGVPGESVVCYDEVMEALVAHACLVSRW